MKAIAAALAGSLLSGFLASACCIGPVVLTLLGVSGGALAHRFEPLRPYLLVSTYGFLAGAFYLSYRPSPTHCGPGGPCAERPAGWLGGILLWIATAVVILSTLFPWYSEYLF